MAALNAKYLVYSSFKLSCASHRISISNICGLCPSSVSVLLTRYKLVVLMAEGGTETRKHLASPRASEGLYLCVGFPVSLSAFPVAMHNTRYLSAVIFCEETCGSGRKLGLLLVQFPRSVIRYNTPASVFFRGSCLQPPACMTAKTLVHFIYR